MTGGDLAGLRRKSQRLRCDLEDLRGLCQVEPGLVAVGGRLVHRDAVMGA